MFNSVPLPEDSSLSEEIHKKLHELPPINVFRMLANTPKLFFPFMEFAAPLVSKNAPFDPRLREISILRQAHKSQAPYEWHQHVFIAKGCGVTDEEIEIIKTEKVVTSLGEEENLLCRLADEIAAADGKLSDETFHSLFSRYSIELGCSWIMLLSYFCMLARFLNATRVQIEKDNPLEGLDAPL